MDVPIHQLITNPEAKANQVGAEDALVSIVDEANILIGCTDDNYIEYNSDANMSNQNLCLTLVVLLY